MHVILDIDGTLADTTHREHHLKKALPDWDSFFDPAEVLKDTPIADTQRVVRRMRELRYAIVFLTSRSESLRDATTRWLLEHYDVAVDDFSLLMRPQSNFLTAAAFKAQAMQQLLAEYKAVGANDFVFIENDFKHFPTFNEEGLTLKAPECWNLLFPTKKESENV